MSSRSIARAWTGSAVKVATGRCCGAHRSHAAVQVRTVHAVVGQLDAGQRAVLVDRRSAIRASAGQVLVVPDAHLDERRDLRGVVDLGLLGADHRPAALGLDPPHLGQGGEVPVSHAVAVRDLVEAVARGHRADLHRLEQDVEAWIPPAVVRC